MCSTTLLELAWWGYLVPKLLPAIRCSTFT